MFRTALAIAITSLTFALPATAQQLSLDTLSRYLNALSSAQGEFTQINDDGTISTGTISIKRPGKARFEYNPPEQALVVVGAGTVAVIDKKVGTAEQYPLSRTPLSIILARNVNLGRADMVTGHTSDGTSTTVRAQDPENPQYGHIDLVFTGNPVQLRQWKITDDAGSQTTVILGALDTSANLPNRLFNVVAEVDAVKN